MNIVYGWNLFAKRLRGFPGRNLSAAISTVAPVGILDFSYSRRA